MIYKTKCYRVNFVSVFACVRECVLVMTNFQVISKASMSLVVTGRPSSFFLLFGIGQSPVSVNPSANENTYRRLANQ